MEIKQIGSWRALTEFFEDIAEIGGNHIYRGVVRADYELIPKIQRIDVIGERSSEGMEKVMLDGFKQRARPFAEHLSKESRDIDWLIVGQHHGLPTRLLDWTLNPLVGTFFAVDWDGQDEDAAIYVEKLPGIIKSSEDFENIFGIEAVEFLYPPHLTARVAAQHGLFTVHPVTDEPYDSDTIIKLVVPSGLRKLIQSHLHVYGINRATLFPGLDGICEELAWSCRWMAWPGVSSE